MLFGLDKATQTAFLLLFTLLVFFFVPLTYNNLSGARLQKLQNKNLLLDWRICVVCIVYAVIFGFRYDYLYDWEEYVTFYEFVQGGGDNNGWREPGFFYFVKGLSSLGLNYYSMFVIECFLWIYSICYLFKDNRKYLFFVLSFVYISSTNEALIISRQYLALSLLLIAYRDYWDGKNIKALCIALVAPLMHYSAAIWLIVFFFLKKIDYIKPAWMVLFFVIVTIASSLLFNVLASSTEFITTIFSSFYDNTIYDSTDLKALQAETTGANFRQMITLGFTRGLYIYLYYRYRKDNLLNNPVLNNIVLIGMVGIIVILLLGYNMLFSRFAAFIRIFYNLGWGVLCYITFFKGRRLVKPSLKVLSFVVVIYLFFGSFILGVAVGRRAELYKDANPYLIYENKIN